MAKPVPPHRKLLRILTSETLNDLVGPSLSWAQTHKHARLEMAAHLYLANNHRAQAYWETPVELRPYLMPDHPANLGSCVHLLWQVEAVTQATDSKPPRVTALIGKELEAVWAIPASQWTWTNLAHQVEAACSRASAGLEGYTARNAGMDVHVDLCTLTTNL